MKHKDNILPCPICGKRPKVISEHFPTGAYVVIRCKRMFSKGHFSVSSAKASWDMAYKDAVEKWNALVKD